MSKTFGSKDTARIMKVDLRTLQYWAKQGFVGIKIGRDYRYNHMDLEKILILKKTKYKKKEKYLKSACL